ncbi:unnamed protein product [Nesidiocoris tenuis]|uniref:Uncharacterized protein n=1 Tax=Nesidiocoris tenuis TaxID=355587 RepID=A0A6H5HHI9_9HEMI|nr:unnamed protein product [Nesidiocoris tenuis]
MRFSQFNTCVEWSTLAINASILGGVGSLEPFKAGRTRTENESVGCRECPQIKRVATSSKIRSFGLYLRNQFFSRRRSPGHCVFAAALSLSIDFSIVFRRAGSQKYQRMPSISFGSCQIVRRFCQGQTSGVFEEERPLPDSGGVGYLSTAKVPRGNCPPIGSTSN